MDGFNFSARLHFSELTGVSAENLNGLLNGFRSVSDSSIYHHTHRFLQQHLAISPEPPNDFAYWVSHILGEEELGESLGSIDIMQFTDIGQLRAALIATVENYLADNPRAAQRFCGKGKDFYFIKSISFILPLGIVVHDLPSFASAIEMIPVDSLYFHMFEARLRLGKKSNDFSCWVEQAFGDSVLAQTIARIDPYSYTLDDLRAKLACLIRNSVKVAG